MTLTYGGCILWVFLYGREGIKKGLMCTSITPDALAQAAPVASGENELIRPIHAYLLPACTHTRGGWCTCAPCRGRGSARSQWPAAGGQGAKGEGGGGGGTVASCMQERASESEGGRHYRACMQGSGGGKGGALVRHSVANTATATQCVLVHTCSSLPIPPTHVHTCSRRSKSCNSSFDCDKVKKYNRGRGRQ